MKAKYLALLVVPALTLGACSQGDLTVPNDAATGVGGTVQGGAGGAGTGGLTVSGSGGTPGTGGASNEGTGGANTTGQGGRSGAGGATGSGGAATGSGGAATGSGGKVTGTGGNATGTGGNAGGTGGATPITVPEFAGKPNSSGATFASSHFIVPCYAQMQQDCVTIPTGQACPNQSGAFELQGLTQTQTFTLGGVVGVNYDVTFTVNGIAEAKYYRNGVRDGGTGPVANAQSEAGTDTFYTGGEPVPVEHYNIYKLVVKTPAGAEVNHYYLNSFPQTTVAYENHQTFPIHYQKTVTMPGGGSVEMFMGDSNCRAVDNCGPGVFSGSCTASRSIPETGFTFPAMYMGRTVASLNVINGAAQPFHAQLIHVIVNSVVKR